MIDLHLLLRISRDDVDFRKKVMTKIHTNAEQFAQNFGRAILQENWNNCFYLLQGFHNQITPYGQLSFLEQVNETMSVLLYEQDAETKARICNRILHSVRSGMNTIKPMTTKKAARPHVHS